MKPNCWYSSRSDRFLFEQNCWCWTWIILSLPSAYRVTSSESNNKSPEDWGGENLSAIMINHETTISFSFIYYWNSQSPRQLRGLLRQSLSWEAHCWLRLWFGGPRRHCLLWGSSRLGRSGTSRPCWRWAEIKGSRGKASPGKTGTCLGRYQSDYMNNRRTRRQTLNHVCGEHSGHWLEVDQTSIGV